MINMSQTKKNGPKDTSTWNSDYQNFEPKIAKTEQLFIFMVMTSRKDCTATRIWASVHQAKRGVPMFWSRLKHGWKFRVSSSTIGYVHSFLIGICNYVVLLPNYHTGNKIIISVCKFKRVSLSLKCTETNNYAKCKNGWETIAKKGFFISGIYLVRKRFWLYASLWFLNNWPVEKQQHITMLLF